MGITDNGQRSKSLTEDRQSNEILTDNRHAEPQFRPSNRETDNSSFHG